MSEFKKGDRVRLVKKPEIEGEVVSGGSPAACGPVTVVLDGTTEWAHRYPEELELVPRDPSWYVGKRVVYEFPYGDEAENRDTVRGVLSDGRLWLDYHGTAIAGCYVRTIRPEHVVRVVE